MENLKQFITFFNLQESANESDIMASIQNQANEISTLKNQLDIIIKENENFKGQLEAESKNKITLLIDSAIRDKKITESQRSIYATLAESNFSATKNALDAIKAYVPISTQLSNPTNSVEEMTFEDYRKKNPQALLQMKKNDFPQYSSLYEKQYGVKPIVN